MGIFYIESPATRQLLKKMRTGDYGHLIVATSIIRPAASRFTRLYVQRLRGSAYAPIHPLLESVLSDTYGILVYQEDVSRVATALAGFSPGQADQLRKLISKEKTPEKLALFESRFLKGALQRGVPAVTARKVWEMILSYQGYSFCKAHSASYALVSFKLAYLKAHHPREFMLAVLNNGGGYYSLQTYLNECRRLGFTIMPPDVNASGWDHSLEGQGIRIGLKQLANLRSGFLFRLLEDRDGRGPFENWADFLERMRPGGHELTTVIRSGALDSLSGHHSRPQLLWTGMAALDRRDLFPPNPAPPRHIGDYSPWRKISDEILTLGVLISRHPVEACMPRIRALAHSDRSAPLIISRDLGFHRNRRVCLAGLLVTGRQTVTRGQESMTFASFEDTFSVYETVFFPKTFARCRALLDDAGLFLVCGRVIDDHGAVSLVVDRLHPVKLSSGSETGLASIAPGSAASFDHALDTS